MTEDSEVAFASEVDGVMHACGHDAHVAMLARNGPLVLAARRDRLPGRVVFMFQPGEEGFAGARVMLDEGLLDHNGPVRPCLCHPHHAHASVGGDRNQTGHADGFGRRLHGHHHRTGRSRIDAS